MKTTIDIPDPLFEEARKLAARQDTTLKALVTEGLRRVVAERNRRGQFQLRKASFKGSGLQPGIAPDDWDRIRDLAYGGRGG
ncbi:MAG: type II toxin-antitoxin system VapB family antitoxin [Rhizobiales bacterium]|nr:type II toxin-antitoxin system VapB family antitoxin [Hyphomicrobiales bacterium]